MKKSFIWGVALFACALGFQSCSDVDNPAPTDEPLVAEIKAGTDLAVLVDKYAVEGVLTLPADAEVTLAEAFETSEPLTIVGDEAKPAKIVAKGGFKTSAALHLENVEIDATEVATPLILLNTLPTEGLNEAGAFEIDNISLKAVTVNGLKNQLVYGNKQKYLIKNLEVVNSTINIAGASKKTVFDFNGGGLPLNVTIDNSTIEADDATQWQNGGLFSTQSGSSLANVTTDADAKSVFSITNSKLTKISNGKTTCTLRQNNQAWQLYVVKNNVIANCGKNGEFLVGLAAGRINKKENWTASGNIITFDGTDIGANENSKSGIENACVVPEAPAE